MEEQERKEAIYQSTRQMQKTKQRGEEQQLLMSQSWLSDDLLGEIEKSQISLLQYQKKIVIQIQ